MLLLVTTRPQSFIKIKQNITLCNIRQTEPDVEKIRGVIHHSRINLEIILFDYSDDSLKGPMMELFRISGDARPFLVVFDTITPRELMELSDAGLNHFRYREQLFENSMEPYLYRLLKEYRTRKLFQDVRLYMEKASREEYVRMDGLLDSLQFGIMILIPAQDKKDYHIRKINGTLQGFVEENLKPYESHKLSELLGAPILPETIRNIFRVDHKTLAHAETRLFHLENDSFLERIITPLYDGKGRVSGYILLFKDVTYEVETGLVDRITGLPDKNHLDRTLSRQIRRFERSSRTECTSLAILLVEIRQLEEHQEIQEQDETHHLLMRTGMILKDMASQIGPVSRYGTGSFMLLIPCLPMEELEDFARDIRRRIKAITHSEEGSHLRVNMGIVRTSRESPFIADREEFLESPGKLLLPLLNEAEQSLRRSRLDQDDPIVLYTRSTGFLTISPDRENESEIAGKIPGRGAVRGPESGGM